jgi:hypothetical protein
MAISRCLLTLRTAVEVNVLVVKRVLDICLQIRECLAFIHVSTAFAHTPRYSHYWCSDLTNSGFIEETVYPPSFDPPLKLMEVMEYAIFFLF